MTGGIVAITRC